MKATVTIEIDGLEFTHTCEHDHADEESAHRCANERATQVHNTVVWLQGIGTDVRLEKERP